MTGSYGAGQIILGALLGFVFGLFFGYGNMRITKAAVKKNGGNGLSAVMTTNFIRSLVNVIALAVVFFTRKLVPLPFTATLLGAATGLAVGNVFFTWLLTKEMKRDMEAAAAAEAIENGGESNEN